ncbi:hypothetical protein [Solicola gregarius]|uniref:Uncharacterized protein n=1 Tax=Solicola gregarius TaxID=2908642 RepID=A0AA46YL93_9ACTN|nr:hypothetical protein [Solicola gregarius]UYM05291.1 hypothetical protein L0C25_22715 [Solicola gregarius]
MRRIKPELDGVDADRADAFARWRILGLRGTCHGRGFKPRLGLVTIADVNGARHLPEDVAWWEPPRPVVGPRVVSLRLVDAGLATEIAARLLNEAGGEPVVAVWTRLGANDETDSDVCWWSALRQGAAIAEVAIPPMLVITRSGWRCVPHGSSRTWRRLRPTA